MTLIPILLPKTGQAITEAAISEWTVTSGQTVAAGDVICQIETDKVEMDIEAPASGVITIDVEAGGPYPVGTQIAHIAEASS